ncbi:CLUMA_CG009830, isoform A [Clunio marinus]|uniref:CLUMA_CG009830, isoform A n=1 Tax=Clunio marinus TaxID=568069 RepID=A0A1J1IBP7_9DIPT|nr:CLUMA_CG009830, isoform A [Clunio marinus]
MKVEVQRSLQLFDYEFRLILRSKLQVEIILE